MNMQSQFYTYLAYVVALLALSGCTGGMDSSVRGSSNNGSGGGTVGGTTASPSQTWYVPPAPVNQNCPGHRIGTYTWSQDYWRKGDSSLMDFLSSSDGKAWACGDVYLNVADYTNPQEIFNSSMLAVWIQNYRQIVGNMQAVVWLTYGDVVEASGPKQVQFVTTFFNWAASIPANVVSTMGTIGLSFDVEHIDPQYTLNALQLAQSLKSTTNFPSGQLLIQHTLEGQINPVGSDYVMRYADSALAMVYRNYLVDPTGAHHEDNNLINRLIWMITQQCQNCLNDGIAISQYKAKITVMVETSCQMGSGCSYISFCAFDGADQGANYMYQTMTQMEQKLMSSGVITTAQYQRLFNQNTPWTVQNFEWYRCYAPFNAALYPQCSTYHTWAQACRGE